MAADDDMMVDTAERALIIDRAMDDVLVTVERDLVIEVAAVGLPGRDADYVGTDLLAHYILASS